MSVLHLTKENFEQEVLQAKEPVLVDFWAELVWTLPDGRTGCRGSAGEVTDAKICKVNVDEQPELARQFRVMSIPTLMVFKNGQTVKREVGAKSKAELLDMLNA